MKRYNGLKRQHSILGMMSILLPKIIRTYAEIVVKPRSLLVFDIDDTLLYFPSHNKVWWKTMEEKNHTREEILHQWREAVHRITPVVIDKSGFLSICDQAVEMGSSLIFLTARSDIMRHTTIRQLRDYLCPVSETQVFFAEKKGPALQRILEEQYSADHNHIIFVDDHPNNHHSVIESFKDSSSYTLDTYLFQGEGLN